jgi:uncharacterized protein YfaS (alpha-2-macroglobulin family)
VVDDKLTLAAVGNNNSGEALPVDISLEAKGVTVESQVVQEFVIEDGGRQRATWTVTVDDVPSVELIFFARAKEGDFSDASRPPLGQGDNQLIPVYKYEVPETVGTAGVLREGGSRTEAIVLPRRFNVTQGELTINVQPSLAALTIEGLDYLRNFPHQCTEQTVSRFPAQRHDLPGAGQPGVADAELKANSRWPWSLRFSACSPRSIPTAGGAGSCRIAAAR